MTCLRHILLVLSTVIASCSSGTVTVNVDFYSFLTQEQREFSSPQYNVPGGTPINQPIPGGLSVTLGLADPVEVNLIEGGSDIMDIEQAAMNFRAGVEPQGFTGRARVRLYLSDNESFSAQGEDVTLVLESQEQSLPATFEIASSDPRLTDLLSRQTVYVKYEAVLTVDQVTTTVVSVAGEVEAFRATLTGKQALL